MKDFIYACKKCHTQNALKSVWFEENVPGKSHSCTRCGNTVKINVKKIRKEIYNDFIVKTEIIQSTVKKPVNVFLQIISNGENLAPVKLENELIEIGRGTKFRVETIQSKDDYQYQRIDLMDKFVSTNHCVIRLNRNENMVRLSIRDTNSLNKTYFNEKPLNDNEELYINVGDLVRIGKTTLERI